MRRLIGALVISMLLSGCGYDGWIRYPCQEFENWENDECKAPQCKTTGTCTSDILGEYAPKK